MMKQVNILVALICVSHTLSATVVSDAEIASMTGKTSWQRGSVHDPSITYTTNNGKKTYYVFGSHMGASKTTDFNNWTEVTGEYTNSRLFCDANGTICSYDKAYSTNKVTSVKNYAGQMVNWGNFDIPAYQGAIESFTVKGNQWAPDMIYNSQMKKWCYYMSLNGSKWNSAIVLFTSDNIEGPFQYQGPVMFSGFNVTNNAATDYKKTDMEIAIGYQASLPARYAVGEKWGTFWPHAIDPGVFYDDKGELWMNYGSWSGGIYVIKLDKNTGLRDYTYTFTSDYDNRGASVTTDPYFGKKIAGGYYVSGEGSYIEKIGKYYYLFMSYGFYSPEGGYEMRIFRSENPDGPYTDHTGESATYSKYLMNYGTKATTNRGMKLMGGYQWEGMNIAEIAQGHNSALLDEDGKAYVIYHTKLNNGTAEHQLRVHQLFVNQDGWITAAPHEYNSKNDNATVESVSTERLFSDAEIAGSYDFILHKYNVDYANYEYTKPVKITLNADGTVSGNQTGTWKTKEGTSYITLTLGNTTYNGVVVPGTPEGTNLPAVCITAMSTSNGVNIWASKLTDKACIAKDLSSIENIVDKDIYGDLDFISSTTANGCTIGCISGNTAVIGNDGSVATTEEDITVELTITLNKGDYSYEKTFDVNVKAGGLSSADIATGLVAYYNFNNNLINQYNTSSIGTANAQANGTKPTHDNDSEHGTVLHQYFGYNDASTISYTTFANPLAGRSLKGFTVSAWVKRLDSDVWDALWSFCDGTYGNIGQRLYLTGNTYIGYNNGNGTWFDYNHPDQIKTNIIPQGQWALVTISYNENGFDIYIDGKWVANQSTGNVQSSGSIDHKQTLTHVSNSTNIYLGYGSFWGSTPALFDDLLVWDRALTATDVTRLYLAEVNNESLLPGEIGKQDTATLTKHGAGSSDQTVKVDSALVSFYYEWTNATGVLVNGLPNGITATIDKAAKKVTISGIAADKPGTYTYSIVTTGTNINTKVERTITIEGNEKTGCGAIAATKGIALYPNPTDGLTTLDFECASPCAASITVYNSVGQQTATFAFNATLGRNIYGIKLPNAKGIYTIAVETNEGIWHKRVIKE